LKVAAKHFLSFLDYFDCEYAVAVDEGVAGCDAVRFVRSQMIHCGGDRHLMRHTVMCPLAFHSTTCPFALRWANGEN
jgi:hypothetical protein